MILSICTGIFGRYLGITGAKIIICIGMIATAIINSINCVHVCFYSNAAFVKIGTLLHTHLLTINWNFLFDELSSTMICMVSIVSCIIHIYSLDYMNDDPHIIRFLSYLTLFTFFMLVFVSAGNLIQLFFGWEGVGICSYLLINFWYSRVQANKAAIKAVLINKMGDVALLLSIILLFNVYKTVDFPLIFDNVSDLGLIKETVFIFTNVSVLYFIGFFFFVALAAKSAQVMLHTWLPDAMEGPTPVSALLHAATMVTAGVFLIIRMSPLLAGSRGLVTIFLTVGLMTAFYSALTALVQNDIKKIIAYSTCSQLGYMVFACGLMHFSVSFFHLINHAAFKALLFLTAGSIIHSLSDEQDIRKMGGLANLMPVTYVLMLIGTLAIIGFPFLTGFYSKDLILEIASLKFTIYGRVLYWIATLTAMLTTFYSFRLIYYVFLNNFPAGHRIHMNKLQEGSYVLLLPLLVLAAGSIYFGYYSKDYFIGLGTSVFENVIRMLPRRVLFTNAEFIPFYIKLVPTICSLLVAGLTILFYSKYFTLFTLNPFKDIIRFSFIILYVNNKHYRTKQRRVTKLLLILPYTLIFKHLDKGFLEICGPYGLSQIFSKMAKLVGHFHTRLIYQYIIITLFSIMLMITLLMVW
jgi:NADH-ubiquinone oxidoreductase chain 5